MTTATLLPTKLTSKVQAVKDRLTVVPIEESYTGIVVRPSNTRQVHKLGMVVSVGAQVPTAVKVGDVVLYQANAMFEEGLKHIIDDSPAIFMHFGDAIAKLDGTEISLNKFTILGEYLLASEVALDMVGGLHIPQNSVPPPEHIIVQVGNTVDRSDDPVVTGLKVGDKVYADRNRCQKIFISDRQYVYFSWRSLHGVNPS